MSANKNQLNDVYELGLCHYLLQFETPLVCQKQSMFVYLHLSSEWKDALEVIGGELPRKELTQNGYDKELTKILTTAGLLLSNGTRI